MNFVSIARIFLKQHSQSKRLISTWDNSKVLNWLDSNGLGKYKKEFNRVDGLILTSPSFDIKRYLPAVDDWDAIKLNSLIIQETEREKKKELKKELNEELKIKKQESKEEKLRNAKSITIIDSKEDCTETRTIVKIYSNETLNQILSKMNGKGLEKVDITIIAFFT